jgi:recombination protein RecA
MNQATLKTKTIAPGLIGRGLEGFQQRQKAELQPTGIGELDALLGGGFPRGSVVELYGPASSGRTSLAFSLLAQATERQEACAFIDVCDSLDPISLAAAGVELPRLLWIQCGKMESGGDNSLQSPYFSGASEKNKKSSALTAAGSKPLPANGWRHPREAMRGVDQAIPRLIGKQAEPVESAQIHVVARCAGEQVERDRELPRRGIWPPRKLAEVRESYAAGPRKRWQPVRTKPWKRLEQALKSADLLLHSGGWGVVVFDLGGISWVDVRRINLSMWFRFRRAIENTPTILLVVGEQSCVKSCASVVLRCRRNAERWSRAAAQKETGAATFEGFEVQGEVLRSRVQWQPAGLACWHTSMP